MKGHWFKFKNREIYLEEDEIFQVHEYYVVQRNANYLKENYPKLTEDEVMEIAWDWRDTELQEGYSNEEIADIIETDEGNVRTILSRGRKALREIIEKEINYGI